MVYNIDTTRFLIERLYLDKNLRRICGWENKNSILSEAPFSRAFAEFSITTLPQEVHDSLIKRMYEETGSIVLHNSRDSTAIQAREKPCVKRKKSKGTLDSKKSIKRGRLKKGEEKISKEPTRIEKQLSMSLKEMLKDLSVSCDIETKRNSKSHSEHWIGYKLHWDTVDGCVPVSAILTSASVHDSQVAIPLATITAKGSASCYDLMDAAYDVPGILDHSRSLDHVPLVDRNPRRDKSLAKELVAESKRQKLVHMESPEKIRYKERT